MTCKYGHPMCQEAALCAHCERDEHKNTIRLQAEKIEALRAEVERLKTKVSKQTKDIDGYVKVWKEEWALRTHEEALKVQAEAERDRLKGWLKRIMFASIKARTTGEDMLRIEVFKVRDEMGWIPLKKIRREMEEGRP